MPQLGFSTTNNAVKEPNVPPSHYHNSSVFSNSSNGKGNKSKSLAEKCEAVEKILSQQIQTRNSTTNSGHNNNSNNNNRMSQADSTEPPLLQPRKEICTLTDPKSTVTSTTNQKTADSQNIEIVTRENSVSEIRIYSGTKVLNITPQTPEPPLSGRGQEALKGGSEIHYAATDIFKMNGGGSQEKPQHGRSHSYAGSNSTLPSRPQSTSVVLIMNSSAGSDSEKSNSIKESFQSQVNMKQSGSPADPFSAPPRPPPLPPMNAKSRIEDTRPTSSLGQSTTQVKELEEPLYDDVINHSAFVTGKNKPVQHETPLKMSSGSVGSGNNPISMGNKKKVVQARRSSDAPPPTAPPPVPPPNKRMSAEDLDSLHSVYSDVGEGLSVSITSNCNSSTSPDELLYDDTQSVHSSYETSSVNGKDKLVQERDSSNASPNQTCQTKEKFPRLINHSATLIKEESIVLEEDEEPLYDDVLNLIHTSINANGINTTGDRDSDSGTETDVPPPLPASGPPVLAKVGIDLPLIPLPSLPALSKVKGSSSISKGTSRFLGEIMGLGKKISGSRDNGIDSSGSSRSSVKSTTDAHDLEPINQNLVTETPAPACESLPSDEVYSDVSPMTPSNKPGESNIKFLLDIPESMGAEGEENEDDVLDRTRTLLNELNDKLAKLSFSPEDYSTYISKVIIPSSSESSGVEEDYNSEKNYSLSNGSGSGGSSTTSMESENYKLSAVSKLVTETISMARGKFLDSMKIINQGQGQSSSPQSPSDAEEPIYEEIGENSNPSSAASTSNAMALANSLLLRSTSPIYADAFDAKSIFDGASRNEILSFLESIRDRLTAAETVRKSSLLLIMH